MSKKTVLFVMSNGKAGAGEREYMKALQATLALQDHPNTNFIICKRAINLETLDVYMANGQAITSAVQDEFSDIPDYTPEILDRIEDNDIEVIGVGNSTLETTLNIVSELEDRKKNCHASYVTHIVNNKKDLQNLNQHNITIFSPTTREMLANIDPQLAHEANLVTQDAVPHTNSYSSCLEEHDKFLETANGAAIKEVIEQGHDFAFAVINAGYGVGETKTHRPYKQQEALEDGYALGTSLAANTALIAAHGGPRNLIDENEFGEKTIDSFMAGYLQAQKEKGGTPTIISERFEKGLPYNVIKAGYILAQNKECKALISNAEGYGTMDGAVLHIDNSKQLLGMFPFDALYEDPTGQRQENINKYNALGVTILQADENKKLKTFVHPEQKQTPYAQRDASIEILNSLNLEGPKLDVNLLKSLKFG